ncbi:hypothetical protein Pmani_039611 [Petrolisthes manimaculis]|uniref:Uncharacterized protein n=1 Tax=Petrolisthes manimaculis TaxID=1843537 RepID=A0AAE1TJC0_9EUCA|nr:hypothetical protein Pmani_039611 [Petrolisthes manimaculis]
MICSHFINSRSQSITGDMGKRCLHDLGYEWKWKKSIKGMGCWVLTKVPNLNEKIKQVRAKSLPPDLYQEERDQELMTTAADLVAAAELVNKAMKKYRTGIISPPLKEVYPGVLIGSRFAVKHLEILQENGVTAVLNIAEGKGYGMVEKYDQYFQEGNINHYLGFSTEDYPSSEISIHFR